MKKNNKPEVVITQQTAKGLPKKKHASNKIQTSEADILKLVHELNVHQIELESQNEELIRSRFAEHEASVKYIELFDFAPMG